MSRLNPLYWFSAISATCVVVLVFTGVLLCLWYEPSPERAYESIAYTSDYVYFGGVLLSLHHYATHLLLASLLLHMIRVFFMGTYKAHRKSWVMGGLLLILTVLFVFTGYLLRWDEVGYWSIRVTASLVAYTPLIGGYLERIILGGGDITSRSLARFFMMHISLLPLISMIVMAYHYSYIKKKEFRWNEIAVGMITFGFLLLYSVLEPFQLAPKVGAELLTPLKPIWLFLWLYVIERSIGMITPSLNFLNILILLAVALLIIVLPYIDKSRETAETKRKRTIAGIIVIGFFVVLSLIGYLWKPPIL